MTKEFAALDPNTINVVWGCGGWGENQIVAEIARGGWGLVAIEAYLAIRPDPSIERRANFGPEPSPFFRGRVPDLDFSKPWC